MSPHSHLHWRRKLHALLHDSPDKTCDIPGHEHRAEMLQSLDQFEKDEFFSKEADWAASAADRVPFPHPNALSEKLADLAEFSHPLGSAKISKGRNFASDAQALEVSQKTRPFLLDESNPRASFICAWRFWRNWASDADPRFAFIPADTRIPDHSIWHHMGVTSAFQGARPTKEQIQNYPGEDLRPRLLLFSIGPVQDFIAAARSTRDLWSGSYLLSYLISTALATIAKDVGPDQVMFPNLLDQPLIDQHLCKEIYNTVQFDGSPIAAGLGYATDTERLQKLLTPSLPNRFLALLPARLPGTDTSIDAYASSLADKLTNQLRSIAGNVAELIEDHSSEQLFGFERTTFDAQVGKLLEIHWQTLPLPETLGELIGNKDALEKLLPPDQPATDGDPFPYAPRKAIQAMLDMAKKCPPQYPVHATAGWGLINALLSWLHDGAKAQRPFEAWREGRWASGKNFNKDTLNGKEEAVVRVTGTKEALEEFCTGTLGMSRSTFKPGELLGASTLIKRLWHGTWLPLSDALNISAAKIRSAMPMPNTRSIASGRPFEQNADGSDQVDGTDFSADDKKYFAILALDGDEMGKWISGSKSPKMAHSLSPKAGEYYAKNGPEFLNAQRAVTPSWHLQFSEALGNFSQHAAQRVVEAFNGRLIYAGGDDVLAMLPATEALECARALRAAFRGESQLNEMAKGRFTGQGSTRKFDGETKLFDIQHDGYLQLHPDSGAKSGDQAKLLSDPVKFPVIVPGPAADVSVGIAIAHFKAPLQDVVKAAQAAEKRAKTELGRGAVAISLFKRSGEILEWGCKWAVAGQDHASHSKDSAGYQLLHSLVGALNKKQLNARFPHKLEALLSPYKPGSRSITPDLTCEVNFAAILGLELDHCLERNQGTTLGSQQRADLTGLCTAYWQELSELNFETKLTRFINLLRSAAWMSRDTADADSSPSRNQPAPA
jgi:CRISPR-associated protein Cmr2